MLSAFMLSVAISQLISGSLSDQFGRKKILFGGSVIFIIGGIGALLSTTIDVLIRCRILQGEGAAACMAMGGLLIAVMSYLLIDESRRGDPVLFRPTSLITAYLALLKTSGVLLHGLTSGLAVGMFFAMGGAMPYAFDRIGTGPLEYGLFFAMTSVGYIL